MTKIAQLWDLFVQADGSSYEKSVWFDIFLSQFIVDLYNGKSLEEILTFCNWSGTGTLIGCELLSDIEKVCSQPGDGDDLYPLRHHLFEKGWKALTVLLALGQQSFSCSHELANLLISLYPACLEMKGNLKVTEIRKPRNKYIRLNSYTIDSFFSKAPFKNKNLSLCRRFASRTEYSKVHPNVVGPRSKRHFREYKNSQNGYEAISSESECLSDGLDVINKSSALKIKLNPMDFDYFTNVIRSDDESRLDSVLYEPKRGPKHLKKISSSDFIDDLVSDVMQSQVSAFELTILIIQLLISMCKSEPAITISSDNSYPVCSKCVKFALENLCSIQFGSVPLQSFEVQETADLKYNLSLLLFISLERALEYPDVTTNVILTGILPMMLRVLEDSVCKLTSDYLETDYATEIKDLYERNKQLEVIFGLICSSISFLLSLLFHNSSVNHLRNFLELFKIFIESSCGTLITNTILVFSRFGNSDRAKKVVDLLGELILGLKKVRKEFISPGLCKRIKLKRFKSDTESHHHHDLFGNIFSSSLMGTSNFQSCCVSNLFMVFVRLLKVREKLSPELLNKILKVMNLCGTCCCFSSKNLFQSLIEIIKHHSRKTRVLVYQLLENTIYSEMGYYKSQHKACLICLKNNFEGSSNVTPGITTKESVYLQRSSTKDIESDMASTRSEKSRRSEDSVINIMPNGKGSLNLDLFREILLSNDFKIVHGVTLHLLKCASKMSHNAKHTVFFNIFFPAFLTSKAHYLSENDNASVFRILSSLSVFSSLLGNVSFAEQFISLKGLNHILELISIPVFSKHCCSVLEKTIVIAVLTPEADISSFTVLRDAVDEANKIFLKLYDMSMEDFTLNLSETPSATRVDKLSAKEKLECRNEIKRNDVLQQVCTFWRTYANLTLFSPILREYFSDATTLKDCKSMLQICLNFLTRSATKSAKCKVSKIYDYSEGHLFTKLIESLLTFILSTMADCEKGLIEKTVIINKLSDALLNNDLRNVDVMRLAEVFLKCSLVQPSLHQVPSHSSVPKLPFLSAWCTGEEDCQDADEIEVLANSESSSMEENYVTADEGYEADIEVRNSETTHDELYESNTSWNMSDSISLLASRDFSFDKSDSRDFNLIVHPKLCSLAIDLLIKLYAERSAKEDILKENGGKRLKHNEERNVFDNSSEKKDHRNFRNSCLSNWSLNTEESYSDQESVSDVMNKKYELDFRTKPMNVLSMKSSDDKCSLGFVSFFHRLVSLCRDRKQNCIILCKDGVIIRLLCGFRKCLSERNDSYSELQRVILDLITTLGSHSISKEELISYLGLFKTDNPPVDHLLNPLTSMVENSKLQPTYSLRFPVPTAEKSLFVSDPDIGKTLNARHTQEGVFSCWSSAALSIPLRSELNWSIWMQGFSLSMWIKVETTATKGYTQNPKCKILQKPLRKISKAESHISNCSTIFSDCGLKSDIYNEDSLPSSPTNHGKFFQISHHSHLHVFTAGNEYLAIECWTATDNNLLLWRLSRCDTNKGYDIIAETTTENCISAGLWHCIAINVQRIKAGIQVTIIVNGGNEVEALLPLAGFLWRKPRPSSLLIGQQSDFVTAKSSISCVMLFACPVFTRERAVYLHGLGPDCSNLTDCQIGRRSPNFTTVLGSRAVYNDISWDMILNDQLANFKGLQDNLLLTYSADNINISNTYSVGSLGTRMSFPGFRPGSLDAGNAQRMPIIVFPLNFAALSVQKHEGLLPSVRLIGGSASFLFLFARVVEITGCPIEQAKSLYLLLKLVQSDYEIFSQFIKNNHYKLIRKVFQSSRCASGPHFIKAILDASCDEPIIQNSGGNFQVRQHSNAIIINSFLISTILDSWRDWSSQQQENDVLKIFFLSLITLTKDDHPSREFNVSQLNRVCMVDNLLTFCKERLLYYNERNLDGEVFYSLIEVVRSLMGAPPDYSHIVAVMNCLVILHPVNETYVTHSKNNFYFLLSAGQSYTVQGHAQDSRVHSESFENEDSKPNQNHRYDNRFTINEQESFNVNYEIDKLTRPSFTRSVDPAKLNKALKNLRLKQKGPDYGKDDGLRIKKNEVDCNLCSDDHTFDSGIAGSYREQVENVEETDGVNGMAFEESQQNFTPFFSSVSCIDINRQSFKQTSEEEKCSDARYQNDGDGEYGSQCIVTEGLLLLLRDTILVLPDNMAYQVLNHVIKLEVLLVFANHKNHRIRSAVVKVISSYLQRSTDEEINKFIKMRGFHHLANQISLYPASLQLVEDCLQLIIRCNVSLEDQIFKNQYEITSFGIASIPPLLALLPRSVHDVSLAKNLVSFLRKLYAKKGNFPRLLLDNGLLEILVKALVASAHINIRSQEESYHNPIASEIVYFFSAIVNHALSTPGIHNLQVLTDIKFQLYYVYRLEKEACGFGAKCVRVIRDALCKILERGLDTVENKIYAAQTHNRGRLSFFSSVRSSLQDNNECDRINELTALTRVSNIHPSISNSLQGNNLGKEMARNELCERFKVVIINAIEFFINSDGKCALSQAELNFIQHLLPTMLQILSSTLEKRPHSKRTTADGIYWALRDTLKTEVSELVVWLLSPRQIVKTRMYLINTLIAESKIKDLIPLLLQTHPQIQQKFSLFLWDLMYNTKLANTDLRTCQELKESLLQWGVISLQTIGHSVDALIGDCSMLLNDMDKQILSWEKQTEGAIMRCITKHECVIKNLTDEALSMTSAVVEAQNVQRKSVIEKMRLNYMENIQITTKWAELIGQLSHERAVWFFEKCYPGFWQLDPTEGPSRVRKRLARCHLGIESRYLLPSHQHKLEHENKPEPLAFLFDSHRKNCPAMLLSERLHCNEKIRTMSFAKVVTPSTEIPGELLLGETCIFFVADDKHNYLNTFGMSSTVWQFEDVKEIHNRRYQLQERAIEIFLINGKTYLIAFQTSKERDDFVEELLECYLPNRLEGDNLGNIIQLWREGLITNWDYLTQLNKMAGRSFNDLMQYPVFPFILSDYQSQTLDLTDNTVYRNFKKPMAVQEKKNEQHYINNYNELLNGLKQVTLNKEPYHYGSHYSNSGTVLHFLVRLPPFTKMLLQYQDQNFDLPDRTFHSMYTTWRLASCDSTTDVKEMVPEFFYLPEFLTNSQGFNFGVRQNGDIVDNVDLPPWCKNDPRAFVLVHRQALESDYVTENLPHWIDLVFGYKQTGKAAVEAINVFHPATYCGFEVESISDPVERTAWETMVKTYGQTPKQLLKNPHPLAVQSLVEAASSNSSFQVVGDVKGLKWGNYVGSPSEPEPTVIWKQQGKDGKLVAQLLALESNDVLGFAPSTTFILRYSKEKGLGLTLTGFRIALVSWSHSDNILRVKFKKDLPPLPVVYVPNLDPISTCQSGPECDQLWIGHTSGNISVYKFKFDLNRDALEFCDLPICLLGHSKSVSHICLCRAYSIAITAGDDSTIIIWDLNSVSYVRDINLSPSHITMIAVSHTLGDIASVSQSSTDISNVLRLHSVNASFIASISIKEKVTALCFSSAPEGISINVIACGCDNGVIRLFSTWNLTPVRDISSSSLSRSVISLTYSSDSQFLYASHSDATFVVWENAGSRYGGKVPKLVNMTNCK